MDVPDLSVVMPGIKTALTGDAVSSVIPFPLDDSSAAEGLLVSGPTHISGIRDTRYFDGVLTAAECASLVEGVSSSQHLSFWNSDESKKESARLFRDADTIEVESPEFAEYMWKRIAPLLDFKNIVIGQCQAILF